MKIETPTGPIEAPDSVRTSENHKKVIKTYVNKEGHSCNLAINIRWDDSCKNGHNSFAITADLVERTPTGKYESGGCLHDEIAERAPELAFCIPYHLVSADGPLHYFANTTFHAGDKDCNGTRKEEQRVHPQKGAMWQLEQSPYTCVYGEQPAPLAVPYVPVLGEGKKPEMELARKTLKWPDATDVELQLPAADLLALANSKGIFPEAMAIQNAVYLASSTDCFGHQAGVQTRNKEGLLNWKMLERPFERITSETQPEPKVIAYKAVLGEGKERELEYARSSAVWPTATDEELGVPKAELEKVLALRLPALMTDFKAVIEQLGFVY